jgi:hypothetical protein
VRASPDDRTGLAVFLHEIHPRTCERRSSV